MMCLMNFDPKRMLQVGGMVGTLSVIIARAIMKYLWFLTNVSIIKLCCQWEATISQMLQVFIFILYLQQTLSSCLNTCEQQKAMQNTNLWLPVAKAQVPCVAYLYTCFHTKER